MALSAYPKIDIKEEKARFTKLDESIDDQYIMHVVYSCQSDKQNLYLYGY